MARMTYKQLGSRANMLLKRMEKQGLENTSRYQEFQIDVQTFWEKRGKIPPTKSGISFSKKMSSDDRKEMAKIVRKFLNSKRKEENEIKKEYQEKTDEYISGLSPKNQEKARDELNLENKSVAEMYSELEKIERILNERKVIESLGSDLVGDIYNKVDDLELDTDTMTLALFKVVQKDYKYQPSYYKGEEPPAPYGIDGLESENLWNVILSEYKRMTGEEQIEMERDNK